MNAWLRKRSWKPEQRRDGRIITYVCRWETKMVETTRKIGFGMCRTENLNCEIRNSFGFGELHSFTSSCLRTSSARVYPRCNFHIYSKRENETKLARKCGNFISSCKMIHSVFFSLSLNRVRVKIWHLFVVLTLYTYMGRCLLERFPIGKLPRFNWRQLTESRKILIMR